MQWRFKGGRKTAPWGWDDMEGSRYIFIETVE